MRVYCLYNQKFHGFFNEVVKLILDTYGSQLSIDTLEEIELVNENEFEYETDGRVVDSHKIIVTSRLYELLLCFELKWYYSKRIIPLRFTSKSILNLQQLQKVKTQMLNAFTINI